MSFFDNLPDADPTPAAATAGASFFDHLPDADPAPVPDTPKMDAGNESWLDYANGLANKIANGQTFHWANEAAAVAGSGFGLGHRVGLKDYGEILEDVNKKGHEFEARHPIASTAADIGGSLIGGAPGARFITRGAGLGARALRSAVVGAGMGAATGVGDLEHPDGLGDYASAAGTGAGIGAATAGALSGASSLASSVVAPWSTRASQFLSDQGIRLTPGDIVGGNAKRLEDTLTAVPFINRSLRARQQEGVDDFNRLAHARTLQRLDDGIGPQLRTGLTELPAGTEVGRQANQFVQQTMRNEYARIVPRLRADLDTGFQQFVDTTRNNLPRSLRDDFDDEMTRHLWNNAPVGGVGRMQGADVQDALQGLTNRGRVYITNGNRDAYSQLMGQALMDVRNRFRDIVQNSSRPQVARKFANINAAYRGFAQTRRASSSTAADFGTFTPAMYHSAVKATDRSAEKGAFSAGTAMNQDLSDAAKSVMTRKINDSGTPERSAVSALIGGVGFAVPKSTIATMGALGALYSHIGNRAFQRAATFSPQTRMALERMMQRGTALSVAPTVTQMEGQP